MPGRRHPWRLLSGECGLRAGSNIIEAMKPINDRLTRATMRTNGRLARKAVLDAVDLQCRSRSMEALAISRELLAMPLYKPPPGFRTAPSGVPRTGMYRPRP